MLQAWEAFLGQVADPKAPWLTAQHHAGASAVQAAYAEVLAGRGDPRVGHILTLTRENP
jgi:hypothetical protein